MVKRRSKLALLPLIGVAAAAALTQVPAAAPPAEAAPTAAGAVAAPTAATAVSPIKHVVILYQENHTFDSMLGAVCQQRPTPCDSDLSPVTLANGKTVDNRPMPDIVPEVSHSVSAQQSGLANRWNEIHGCQPTDDYMCITHATVDQIPNLTSLANAYTVSDRTFASDSVSSFTAHVEITTGSTAGYFGLNPLPSKTGAPLGKGWGCPSNRDAPWGVGYQAELTWEPSCIPTRSGAGPYRPSRVPYTRSIMEQLQLNDLSWRIYIGYEGRPFEGFNWNICSYIAWCQTRHRDHQSYFAKFKEDALAGNLPAVSLVPATNFWSQHNLNSLSQGDNYIGDMVDAAMQGPDWGSTAIFITYDDCGCFYDHVTPPANRGFRNPMVIVSPWAKPEYTDSTVAEQPYSMLAFIDHNWGMRPLTPRVGQSYDYGNAFDFSSPPTTRKPTMVHTHIAKAIKAEVRRTRHLWEDDIT